MKVELEKTGYESLASVEDVTYVQIELKRPTGQPGVYRTVKVTITGEVDGTLIVNASEQVAIKLHFSNQFAIET